MYLTKRWSSTVPIIMSEVGVAPPITPDDKRAPDQVEWLFINAIWDTGASNSCITDRIATKLQLQQIAIESVSTANGTTLQPVYLIALAIRGDDAHMALQMVKVSAMPGIEQADMLIGMDIITLGDFAVTNKDGKTWMSFRCPSTAHTDYGSQSNYHKPKDKKKRR